MDSADRTVTPQPEIAVLGGGCFWCLEAAFQEIRGITSVEPGYAGGHTLRPTYEQVSTGETGHAEVVHTTFDPSVITYNDLLEIFFALHDPTTPNRQGNDIGPEYRSIILYTSEEQQKIAEATRATVQTLWPGLVTTEIKLLDHFWPAEESHHNYFRRNPAQAYCQIVINPKLQHLRAKFQSRLKPEYQ